ncbi:GNAT family N-acetyltransferase [Hyalangium minutum]|uniref:Acetyltransferase, GNAT family protein n=1 Tax=Hyalangium minutum TaxID=394096 RepID=A0A085WKN6_9BACT|nr:GNAT family N-acetyltransferase [Hyalangium minutum]KFE68249.1 Acetyltransferase, GNAT family protein [Hyalangium minutum]
MSHTFSLRPVSPSDDTFLFELYASTRAELAALGLGEAQRQLLLRVQWMAQRQGYQSRYPHSEHQLVLVEGRPVGRLWVAREPEELRLVDVSLLPSHRGSGVGTGLLRALQQEAATTGKPLRLSVARDNPAQRLYARLGFTPVGGAETGVDPYLALEWRPAPREGERGT